MKQVTSSEVKMEVKQVLSLPSELSSVVVDSLTSYQGGMIDGQTAFDNIVEFIRGTEAGKKITGSANEKLQGLARLAFGLMITESAAVYLIEKEALAACRSIRSAWLSAQGYKAPEKTADKIIPTVLEARMFKSYIDTMTGTGTPDKPVAFKIEHAKRAAQLFRAWASQDITYTVLNSVIQADGVNLVNVPEVPFEVPAE